MISGSIIRLKLNFICSGRVTGEEKDVDLLLSTKTCLESLEYEFCAMVLIL